MWRFFGGKSVNVNAVKTAHRVSKRLKILDNNFTNIKHTNGDCSIEQSPLTIVYINVTPSVHRIQECQLLSARYRIPNPNAGLSWMGKYDGI